MREFFSILTGGFKTLFFLFLLCMTSVSYALPFTIVPVGTLPTAIPNGGTATATYTVLNNTNSTRNNNYFKYLPPNVTHVTSGIGACGTTFNLAAHASCTLTLTVTGAINSNDPERSHHLFACFPGGTTCAGTDYPLNVRVAPLTSISVTPLNPSVAYPATRQFTATGNYDSGQTRDLTNLVTWTSLNTNSATINSSGLATPSAGTSGGGSTVITATYGLIAGVSTLTVVPNLVSIAVTPTGQTIDVGNTLQFIATGTYDVGPTQILTNSVTWSSSDASKATITAGPSGGLATGVAAGSANMIATSGLISGSTALTVRALASIAVTPANPGVLVAGTKQFTATGTYTDATTRDLTNTATWSSSNTNLATITLGGLATGVALGKATISAALGLISGSTVLSIVQGVAIAVGEDDTVSQAPLLLTSLDAGFDWNVQTTFTGTYPAAGSLRGASCAGTGSSTSCIAAGQDGTGTTPPLLLTNFGGGNTWNVQTTFTGTYPANGSYNAASCSTSGTCVAVGSNSGTGAPLLVSTIDSGATWVVQDFSLFTTNASFYSANCSGTGSSTVCVAGGADSTAGPFLILTSDNWTSWGVLPLYVNGYFGAVSSVGSGTSALVIAAGQHGTAPLLIETTDGVTFNTMSISGIPASGYFSSASCSTAMCVLAGTDTTSGYSPLLAQTTNGGGTWSVQTTFTGTYPVNGYFDAVSCSGSDGSTVCVAVGKNSDTGAPLLVKSLDYGATWSVQDLSSFSTNGELFGVNCSVSLPSSTSVCVAAGWNVSAPLLLVSLDGGSTWNKQTTFSGGTYPAAGYLYGAGNSVALSPELQSKFKKEFGARSVLKKLILQRLKNEGKL